MERRSTAPSICAKRCCAHSDEFVQTFTEKMMTYALGRGVEYYDMPAIRKIVRNAKADNYKFSSIVMGIVGTPAFQSSITEQEKPKPAPQQVAAK